MATKPTAKKTTKPAPKSTSAKSAKTAKSAASTKPKTTKTTSTNTKPAATRRNVTHRPPHKSGSMGRTIAIVIGIIAGVALIGVALFALVNSINNGGKNNMTVETSTGEVLETQYLGFNDYKFQLKIPKAFHALTEAEIKQKYPTNLPQIVYSDSNNEVNIAISTTDTELSNDNVETYLKTMDTSLGMAGTKVLSSNVAKQGDYNIGKIEFVTDSSEGKYYNYTAIFSQDGKLNIVTFNVKDIERETWQPVAKFIINSIDFTDKN